MGYASEDLERKYAAEQRGELARVEVPDGSARIAWVKTGAREHALDDGRILRLEWSEVNPPKVGHATVEGPIVQRAQTAVALLRDAAAEVRDLFEMPARDRNAIIGQLRNVAAQIRGFRGLDEWPAAPFDPLKAGA